MLCMLCIYCWWNVRVPGDYTLLLVFSLRFPRDCTLLLVVSPFSKALYTAAGGLSVFHGIVSYC